MAYVSSRPQFVVLCRKARTTSSPSNVNETSDARLGPRSSPRVARRLNGFDSEIDYTLEALKVVEVKASPRGSPHCMRKDDTIAAECVIKNRKLHLKIPPATERGNQDFPSELLPTQRDFQQQQQRTTSCRQLYRGTAQLECPAQPTRRKGNVPLQRVVVRTSRNAPLSSPGVGQRRGGVSMAGSWNTRAML